MPSKDSITWNSLSAGQRAILKAHFGHEACQHAASTKGGDYPLEASFHYTLTTERHKYLTEDVVRNVVYALIKGDTPEKVQELLRYLHEQKKSRMPLKKSAATKMKEHPIWEYMTRAAIFGMMLFSIAYLVIWLKIMLFTPHTAYLQDEGLITYYAIRIGFGGLLTLVCAGAYLSNKK